MDSTKKRIDVTSADLNQSGFEYQYLYFILKLFSLFRGDEVGYEALDDVHTISFREEKTYLFQLKHTVEKVGDGEQVNLTTLSLDFWKTLSNWSKLISDPAEARNTKTEQKKFLNRSGFVFVTNRKTNKNKTILKIEQMKVGKIQRIEFIDYLKDIKSTTKNKTIKEYIDDILLLNAEILQMFFCNIEAIDSPNNLFDDIREQIRNKMIPEEYIDEVLSKLYLQLKEDFFEKISKGQHQIITYEEWITRYRAVFDTPRVTLLPLRTYNPILPEHLEQQNFVKELVEINAIDLEDYGFSEIAEFTNHYLCIAMQLEAWQQEGRITLADVKSFHKNAIASWKSIHRACHRSTKNCLPLDSKNALSCFDDIMKENLDFWKISLGAELSNGEFIKLADEERIGWKYIWKDRYYDGE